MSLFPKKTNPRKKAKGDTASPLPKKGLGNVRGRSLGRPEEQSYLESSQIIEGGLFILFTIFVIIICFLGQREKGPRIILNQNANQRVVAEFPFEFKSQILTEERLRGIRAQVPPVYQRTFEPLEMFRNLLGDFNEAIAKNQIEYEDEGSEVARFELIETISTLFESASLNVDPKAILQLSDRLTPRERSSLFNDALAVLKSLYEDGIYPSQITEEQGAQITVIQLMDGEGRSNLPNSRSFEDALISLRVRINALSGDETTARSLFDIFKNGVEPNLLYSERATVRSIERALSQVETPMVSYTEGDTLIEPGAMIGPKDIELMTAYREIAQERGGDSMVFNSLFAERVVLTVMLLLPIYFYVKLGLGNIGKRNRVIAVTAVCILLNLIIIRLIIEVGEIALLNNRPTFSMLPYIVPYALAPILVAVLVGTAPAVLTALIISVLFGVIQDNSIEFFLISLLSGVVGSFIALKVRKRANVVRAGLFAGISAALAGVVVGLLHELTFGLLGQQTVIALVVGVLTGVLVVGLLPVFEGLFNITTEITLLELTDFNHPLLRRMQMEAPGTYHHSLMVANLSENAAAAIGASPLLCRVCSFFHDIGKMVKPEYFVENQRGGVNPHDNQNPSMSALVIKAHVKEGVELARKHKLPLVIIDVIRQHHGTGLIQFFYYQAQQRKNIETQPPFSKKNGKPLEMPKVEESTYRYDGPRPAFKESAIIFFADSVEAASRSLKKVSQPAIEELIDNIFKGRIDDRQLDKCPLTFMELNLIRESFVYTLLNMLHSRMEYPKGNPKKEVKDVAKDTGILEKETKELTNGTAHQQPI